MNVLDSSAMVEILKKTGKGIEIVDRFENMELAITSLSVFEILNGSSEKTEDADKEFLSSYTILNLDEKSAKEASKIYKELSKKGNLIGEIDMFIGGICISNSAKLITLDKDFSKIKDLKCEIIE